MKKSWFKYALTAFSLSLVACSANQLQQLADAAKNSAGNKIPVAVASGLPGSNPVATTPASTTPGNVAASIASASYDGYWAFGDNALQKAVESNDPQLPNLMMQNCATRPVQFIKHTNPNYQSDYALVVDAVAQYNSYGAPPRESIEVFKAYYLAQGFPLKSNTDGSLDFLAGVYALDGMEACSGVGFYCKSKGTIGKTIKLKVLNKDLLSFEGAYPGPVGGPAKDLVLARCQKSPTEYLKELRAIMPPGPTPTGAVVVPATPTPSGSR